MKVCEATRVHQKRYQHQCPHCRRWNGYGMYAIAHDHLDLIFKACACGRPYKVLRGGCDRATPEGGGEIPETMGH